MESAPLFRQVCLLLQNPRDVDHALDILTGKLSISQVADFKAQESSSFDGDGDVLVLSYTSDLSSGSQHEAKMVLGSQGDHVMMKQIIPAIATSSATIESVIRSCNLSIISILALAEALRRNRHLIGFSVLDNPGNYKNGDSQLRRACIDTYAPLKWFQGQFLSDNLVAARQQVRWMEEKKDEDASPIMEMDALRPFAMSLSQCSSQSDDEDFVNPTLHTKKKGLVKNSSSSDSDSWNDRERWLIQVKEQIRSTVDDEAEVERIVDNLELYELEKRIESILSVSN